MSHTFALADVAEAMRAKWTGAVIGGAVVHPGGTAADTGAVG